MRNAIDVDYCSVRKRNQVLKAAMKNRGKNGVAGLGTYGSGGTVIHYDFTNRVYHIPDRKKKRK